MLVTISFSACEAYAGISAIFPPVILISRLMLKYWTSSRQTHNQQTIIRRTALQRTAKENTRSILYDSLQTRRPHLLVRMQCQDAQRLERALDRRRSARVALHEHGARNLGEVGGACLVGRIRQRIGSHECVQRFQLRKGNGPRVLFTALELGLVKVCGARGNRRLGQPTAFSSMSERAIENNNSWREACKASEKEKKLRSNAHLCRGVSAFAALEEFSDMSTDVSME